MSTAAGSPCDDTAISKKHHVPDDEDIDQIYGPTPARPEPDGRSSRPRETTPMHQATPATRSI